MAVPLQKPAWQHECTALRCASPALKGCLQARQGGEPCSPLSLVCTLPGCFSCWACHAATAFHHSYCCCCCSSSHHALHHPHWKPLLSHPCLFCQEGLIAWVACVWHLHHPCLSWLILKLHMYWRHSFVVQGPALQKLTVRSRLRLRHLVLLNCLRDFGYSAQMLQPELEQIEV